MGAAGYVADTIVDRAVQAAGLMLIPADVFPPVWGINLLMPVGKGGPGTIAEGAASWLDGAEALGRARAQVDSLCASLGRDAWDGADRELFDVRAREFSAQLDTASTFAEVVGATLAGLAVPLGAYGGVCLGIGGVLLSEALAFEAAVASVVGNLGPSEAAYAAGCATAATCLAVLGGVVAGYAALLQTAAAVLGVGSLVDVHEQAEHGDTSALSTYGKAQVDGLGEVGKNLEGFAAGVATDAIASKLPGTGNAYVDNLVGGEFSSRLGDVNSAVVDGVSGEGPGQVLKDLSGYGDEIDAVEDLFDGDQPPPNDHDDVHYDLPPTPPTSPPNPVQPLPPATDDGPGIVPIPPADEDDYQVIPVGSDINDGSSGAGSEQQA
ncbi:hypothetical protein SAMN05443575_2120 [Jatrophihabitans endophyticus]|uniref:Uncharacterized protein n=1 Tax=Jatrophihabitans endophyticus TaxID=1206085 RepID=A0A1M5KDQ4_9ACTN|nr:hypothetical protein [Jatrophihabitans endophyticus]SHG50730.1 hypothetical protein SAMN05443575_2120 [Jatrophihabitans endophyticus]